MVDYREILRLFSLKCNYTQIAEALHSSRNKIWDVGLAAEKGIWWPLEEELTNQKLYELLYPDRLKEAQSTWNRTALTFIQSFELLASHQHLQ